MGKTQIDFNEQEEEVIQAFMFLKGLSNKKEAIKEIIKDYGLNTKNIKVMKSLKKGGLSD